MKIKISLNQLQCVIGQKNRFIVTVVVFMTACSTAVPRSGSPVNNSADNSLTEKDDSVFTNMIMKGADGRDVALEEVIKGDIILLSFWTTYCTKCKKKLADHQLLHKEYSERGLSVLGASLNEPENESQVASFVRTRGLTFPIVIDSESTLVNQFNPRRTLPFSVLLDRRGNILWSHVGYVPGDEKLVEEQILKAMEAMKGPKEYPNQTGKGE